MIISIIMLALSLAFILLVCAVFTNAVEWLGDELNLGQGVTGSVLAAVGTALPETIIPIIAIVFSGGAKATDIGIGAIAGAPFMLGTLGFFITGAAVIIYSGLGKRTKNMSINTKIFSRDLTFFIIVYGIAILTTFVSHIYILKIIIAIMLLLSYGLYIKLTFADQCENCAQELEELYLTRFFKTKKSGLTIVVQLVLALLGIVLGAHLFVINVEAVSQYIGLSPLILSIIITPIATELPEKLNSIIWIGKKKDTLALGNITGAMVFQSCFPVAFGIILTSWKIEGITMVSALIVLVSAILNLAWVKVNKKVSPYVLMSGLVFYCVFLIYVFK